MLGDFGGVLFCRDFRNEHPCVTSFLQSYAGYLHPFSFGYIGHDRRFESWVQWDVTRDCGTLLLVLFAGPLGLMGREQARQTSKPSSNPSWDATGHPVCETFIVVHVV